MMFLMVVAVFVWLIWFLAYCAWDARIGPDLDKARAAEHRQNTTPAQRELAAVGALWRAGYIGDDEYLRRTTRILETV